MTSPRLPPVLRGGFPEVGLEDRAEVFLVVEAGFLGDLGRALALVLEFEEALADDHRNGFHV